MTRELIFLGALGCALPLLGGQIFGTLTEGGKAVASGAEVTILHVVPPSDLDYPSTRDVRDHLNDLADTDTLAGRSLRRALEMAKTAGLRAKAVAREGHIVEQILAEIKAGDHDIICMGSSYSAHSLRQLYTPNVTADIAEVVHCPVLTARFKPA